MLRAWAACLAHLLSRTALGVALLPHDASLLARLARSSRHAPRRLGEIRSAFEEIAALELERPSVPEGMRLLIGIFSTAEERDGQLREIHRTTWMQRPWVCDATASDAVPSAQCAVYVTFVLGRRSSSSLPSASELLSREGQLTMMAVKENMNEGKTPAWFHHAPAAFPWATHVAKMDGDAAPYLRVLFDRLAELKTQGTCGNLYFGSYWTSCTQLAKDRHVHCAPKSCGYPVGGNFLRYTNPNPRCFSYMQGAFYAISRSLAFNASAEGSFWAASTGPEDLLSGSALAQHAREQGLCVVSVDISGAFLHMGHYRKKLAPLS